MAVKKTTQDTGSHHERLMHQLIENTTLLQKKDAGFGKFCLEGEYVVFEIDTGFFLGDDVAVVKLLIHLHQGDTGDWVTISDRFGDTERAAVFG